MTSVALVGAGGYVGQALSAALSADPRYTVANVTRLDYDSKRRESYDIVINAAMPSARFRAQNDPENDFQETVKKTADFLYGWNFKKFVQISSVSARCQLNTVYGRHKAAAEALCPKANSLILRLGPMYSESLSKGVLIDMLNGKDVFVAGESRYCFAPLAFVASWIAGNLDRSGLVEVGGRNAISLQEIATHLGVSIKFQGPIDHQEMPDPAPDYPEARDVLKFVALMRGRVGGGKAS